MIKYIVLVALAIIGMSVIPSDPQTVAKEQLHNAFHTKYISCMASTRDEDICNIYRK